MPPVQGGTTIVRRVLWTALAAGLVTTGRPAGAEPSYANGLLQGLGDPTVIYQEIGSDGGYYYGTGTGAYVATAPNASGATGTITVYRSKSLADLFHSTDTISVPVHTTPASPKKGGTATSPGLFYTKGRMYLTYKDVEGNHTQVAYSTDPDPTKPWVDDTTADFPGYAWVLFDRKGSSGQPLNQLYGFYTKPGFVHVVRMLDPLHPDMTTDTVISKATDDKTDKKEYRPWEHVANIHPPGANEGPDPFVTNDRAGVMTTWVAYSANSYRSDAYAVGLLKFVGQDSDLFTSATCENAAQCWVKQQDPFFAGPGQGAGDNIVFSTGANNLLYDRAGQLWNVYGARFHSAYTNGRELRMDPVAFGPKGNLLLRQPGPSAEGQLVPLPGGDQPKVTSRFFALSSTEIARSFGYDDPRVYYSVVSGTPTTSDDPYQADQMAPWSNQHDTTSYKATDAPYAYYMIQFIGRSIAITAPTGPGFGTASIFKDGALAGQVDFGQSVVLGPAFKTDFQQPGEHTLLVMVLADDPSNPKPLAKDQPNHKVGLTSFTISRGPQ